MVIKHERLAAFEGTQNDIEITEIHNLLTANTGFFIDRELALLLTSSETSRILKVPIRRVDIGDSILSDLVIREQIRWWSNLPEKYWIEGREVRGISLLSVLEYLVNREKGIVNDPGNFSLDESQVALQKRVLGKILAQVPDWKKRVVYYEAA